MRSLLIEAVKIFFQDQLAMAGNQQAVNVDPIVGRIGRQNFFDQRCNWLLVQPNIGERRSCPSVIAANRLGVRIFLHRRSARGEAQSVILLAPRKLKRRISIEQCKREMIG